MVLWHIVAFWLQLIHNLDNGWYFSSGGHLLLTSLAEWLSFLVSFNWLLHQSVFFLFIFISLPKNFSISIVLTNLLVPLYGVAFRPQLVHDLENSCSFSNENNLFLLDTIYNFLWASSSLIPFQFVWFLFWLHCNECSLLLELSYVCSLLYDMVKLF